MCRELKREPAWIAAIKLAITRGWVTADAVVAEANLVEGREPTVRNVLSTMADRDMLTEAPEFQSSGRYLVGPVLRESAPANHPVDNLSESGVHRWERASGD